MATKKAKPKLYMCDFETTLYIGQDYTEVWAAACVEFYTEDVKIFHSIGEQFDYFVSVGENVIAYYHNLKFDGQFWMAYLLEEKGFTQSYTQTDKDNINTISFDDRKSMKNNSVIYTISEMGQWYKILIKVRGRYIEIRDSLKLLPFSVKRIGQSFKTKHKKLDMEYKGYRYAGCEITEKEKEYIANDVLVVKEALEIMFNEGHDKLTIGACCLAEFKKSMHDTFEYEALYPDLYARELDENVYGFPNEGEYIRQAYRGGWCYVAKGKERKIYNNGTTADVNSLYPSMMSSESGNIYPTGTPTFWKGNYIPDEAYGKYRYFFVRIKTRFYIKKNKLPFIQIKNSLLYRPREMLETSDVVNPRNSKYYSMMKDRSGNKISTRVTMTMTCTDYKLFLEQYNVKEFEILDGCYFDGYVGLFDSYIEKYKKLKMESTGAQRELAKLFLNNLYGKMAASTDSSFKVAYLKDNGVVGYLSVVAHDKQAGYIPVGAAITSYARNFTIRAAQANYYGKDKRGFIYADTDSIHCDLAPNELKNITVDDKKFCCWKLESCWDKGIFIRAKTYAEHIVKENLKDIENPYWNLKCAGMPEECKKLFLRSMDNTPLTEKEIEENKYDKEKIDFINKKRTIEDFDIGLVVPGKLRPKRIKGGILLEETTYEMRDI